MLWLLQWSDTLQKRKARAMYFRKELQCGRKVLSEWSKDHRSIKSMVAAVTAEVKGKLHVIFFKPWCHLDLYFRWVTARTSRSQLPTHAPVVNACRKCEHPHHDLTYIYIRAVKWKLIEDFKVCYSPLLVQGPSSGLNEKCFGSQDQKTFLNIPYLWIK